MIPHLDALCFVLAVAASVAAWRARNGGYAIGAAVFLAAALVGHV